MAEPVPKSYRVIPHYSPVSGTLTSFTVEDPEGVKAVRWRQYVDDVARQYSVVPKKDIEDATVSYTDYRVLFVLGRTSFTLEDLKGKPAARDLSTPERLMRYGVKEEDFQKVIELDGKYSLEQLRDLCRAHHVPTSGDKKKLISRLLEAGVEL